MLDPKNFHQGMAATGLHLFTYEIQKITPAQPNLISSSNCDFTEDAVTKVLDKTKVNKTHGPDCIALRVLKEAKYQISNKSLNSGRVSDTWKLANVTPLQKKGDKTLLVNYRPISLTSIVCKLMKTIIHDKLMSFIEENIMINNTQHGFMTNALA